MFNSLVTILITFISTQSLGAPSFDFKKYLFGEPSSLGISVSSLNKNTGQVTLTGGDSRCPNIPFTWDWGDGEIIDGWIPQQHTFSDISKNYIVTVTAHYSSTETDSVQLIVRFITPSITPVTLPDNITVTIPSVMPTLTSRLYSISQNLSVFHNDDFEIIPRTTIEYILSVAANIQMDLVNEDVFQYDGKFNQVMLYDSTLAGGMYSLWFTNPVSFGVGKTDIKGTIGYTSFIHEMGHNFTLNSPADYYYGGKMDGCANAIFSESMAQIFQHATGYEIINNFQDYGLSEDLMLDLKQSFISSIKIVRNHYDSYIETGKNFESWNEPNTPGDETIKTFMTIAYQFCVHAENSGLGYRQPLKRMMRLLQVFNEQLRQQYDQHHNTAAADTFRATLMTTAVAYGFGQDLRDEFRDLGFPISDAIYEELIGMVNTAPIVATRIEDTTISLDAGDYVKDLNAFPSVFDDADDDSLSYSVVSSDVGIATTHILGSVLTISPVSIGTATITITANDGQNESVSTSFQVTVAPPIGVEIQSGDIPEDYGLSQNFPNPFNPLTRIQFTLPRASHVVLTVLDIMGREITVLVDTRLQAGTYIYNWKADNLPSGAYFYRLRAGGFQQTKKLLLTK